jgi:hypothetical protein
MELVLIFAVCGLLLALGVPAGIFITHLLSGRPDASADTLKALKPFFDFLRSGQSLGARPVSDWRSKQQATAATTARLQRYEALQRLQDLLDRGTISREQYENEKAAILSDRQR